MLKANYLFCGTDGAVIYQNPDSDAYALMRSFPLVSLDVETFASAVKALLNTVERSLQPRLISIAASRLSIYLPSWGT